MGSGVEGAEPEKGGGGQRATYSVAYPRNYAHAVFLLSGLSG